MGHEIGKLKLMMLTCTFWKKWHKNPPGKGSTLCKNMLLLAIDISRLQRFTTAVVMNKTERLDWHTLNH